MRSSWRNCRGISSRQPAPVRSHFCGDGRGGHCWNHDDGPSPHLFGEKPGSGLLGCRCYDRGVGPADHSFWASSIQSVFHCPPQELARIAGYNLGPEDRLIQFGRKRPSLAFYAKRKVFQINPGEDGKFETAAAGPSRKMIILQTHLRSQLPASVRDYPVVLERHGFSLLSSESFLK